MKQSTETPDKTSKHDSFKESVAEKTGVVFETTRLWLLKSWKLGLLMTKGAYLLSERRRLFSQLGEEVYYRTQKGEMKSPDLEPIIHQIDRLTRKVELEERQIRNVRFRHTTPDPTESDAPAEWES